jgi:hypothetical protein
MSINNTNTGGPAFPYEERNGVGEPYADHFGMTLRDYFAAKVLQGFISRGGQYDGEFDAKRAYAFADAMLKVRGAE